MRPSSILLQVRLGIALQVIRQIGYCIAGNTTDSTLLRSVWLGRKYWWGTLVGTHAYIQLLRSQTGSLSFSLFWDSERWLVFYSRPLPFFTAFFSKFCFCFTCTVFFTFLDFYFFQFYPFSIAFSLSSGGLRFLLASFFTSIEVFFYAYGFYLFTLFTLFTLFQSLSVWWTAFSLRVVFYFNRCIFLYAYGFYLFSTEPAHPSFPWDEDLLTRTGSQSWNYLWVWYGTGMVWLILCFFVSLLKLYC